MGYPVPTSNTTTPLQFLMVLSSDHITGATGKSPTVTIKKLGGSFATPAGAVTEIANGWYQVAANAVDANTAGPLLLHATASACDPRDDTFTVVNYNPSNVSPISPPTTAAFGTTTARQIIQRALELVGVKAQGESLSAAEGLDGLYWLNLMIDGWGAENLTALVVTRDVFDLVASQQEYTVGTGGDWDIVRPVYVTGAGLILNTSSPSIEIPLALLDDNSYEAIGIKALTNTLPTMLYYNPTFPLATAFLWPNPTDDSNQIAFYSRTVLTGFADLPTQYAFAPSYLQAIIGNLAKLLAVPYGRELPQAVAEMAATSFGRMKRANLRSLDARLDLGLTPRGRTGWYNINTDTGA